MGSAVLLMLLSQAPDLQFRLSGIITAGAVLKVGVLPPPALLKMLRVVAKVAPFVSVPGDKTPDPEHYASAFGNKSWAEKAFADPLIVKDVKLGMMPVVLDTLLALPGKLGNITEVPVLVLHGTNDTRAHYSGSEELVGLIGSRDKELMLYDGMQHQLLQGVDEDVQRVVRDIGEWMKKRLP
jgi:alpha-beta hydrolase superfamily lysophospholipase